MENDKLSIPLENGKKGRVAVMLQSQEGSESRDKAENQTGSGRGGKACRLCGRYCLRRFDVDLRLRLYLFNSRNILELLTGLCSG